MLKNDPRRFKARLTEREKLDIIGISAEEFEKFFIIMGATLKAPWAEWKYDHFAEQHGVDPFEIDSFTPEQEDRKRCKRPYQADHWMTRNEYPATRHAVLDHLCRRGKIIALRGLWESRGASFVSNIRFDLDCHNDEQRRTLPARVQTVRQILPFPCLELVSSRSEGRYLNFPLAWPECLFVPYQFDPSGGLGVIIGEEGNEVFTEPLFWYDVDEISAVEQVEHELIRIGFGHGDIEVFPQRNKPLRFPLGVGGYLIDENGWPVEDVGDAIREIIAFKQRHHGEFPFFGDLLDHLRATKPMDMPWRKGPTIPRTAESMHQPHKQPSENPFSVQNLLEHGLPFEDSRYEALPIMIRHFYFTQLPATPNDLADLVWGWLSEKHNGFSTQMGKNKRGTMRYVLAACKGWFRKLEKGFDPSKSEARVHLQEADLQAVLRIVEKPRVLVGPQRAAYLATLNFIADFLRYCKRWLVKRGIRFQGNLHIIDIPLKAWVTMQGVTKKSDRPSYYGNRIALLKALGLLEDLNTKVKRRQCRQYRLNYEYATIGPKVSDNKRYFMGKVAGDSMLSPP